MLKVILDTNVIIASLIGRSSPYEILFNIVFENKVALIVSDEILLEYYAVLNRDKFSRYPDFKLNAAVVLSRIEEIAVKHNPSVKVDVLNDKSDNKFLELALATNANYLVTGNTNDFTIDKIEKTVIVSPLEFVKRFTF